MSHNQSADIYPLDIPKEDLLYLIRWLQNRLNETDEKNAKLTKENAKIKREVREWQAESRQLEQAARRTIISVLRLQRVFDEDAGVDFIKRMMRLEDPEFF